MPIGAGPPAPLPADGLLIARILRSESPGHGGFLVADNLKMKSCDGEKRNQAQRQIEKHCQQAQVDQIETQESRIAAPLKNPISHQACFVLRDAGPPTVLHG